MDGLEVGAVVTWFRPPPTAVAAVERALAQCAVVVVVDNTPAGEPALRVPDGAVLLRDGCNRGLAAAVNAGVRALPEDLPAVLLLDQDSLLPDGAVAHLSTHLAVPEVGAVGPAPWDEAAERYLDPRTALRPEVADLPVLITSGLLLRRSALLQAGPLREDFFVDAVDLDLCLRLRRAGWRLRQDRRVLLPHALGDTRWHRVLGLRLRATHHPTWRLYGAARNSALLSREHLRSEPRWATVNLLLLAYWLMTVVLFEPPRRERARLFAQGLADGWRRRPPRRPLAP